MADIYLHLGYPKTGTTTLQKHVFPNHPDIEYLGKRIPDYDYVDKMLLSEISQIINRSSLNYKNHLILKNLIDEWRTKSRKSAILISTESILHTTATDPSIVAKRIYDAFYPCKVIIVLREQKDILRSFYGMHGRFAQYLFLARNEMERLKLPMNMNDWLTLSFRSIDRNFPGLLHYDKVISCYSNLFGHENIGIYLYEELCNDQNKFISNISDFMKIDANISISLLNGKYEHATLSKGELIWWRIAWLLKLKKQDETFIRRHRSFFHRLLSESSSVDDVIPNNWKNKIDELYAEGNSNLESDWKIPLSEYGYAVKNNP